MNDEQLWRQACSSDACNQGRGACPVPLACRIAEPSALSWRLSDFVIGAIFVGFIAGWFAGLFA
jgi:hypothetical protein